LDVPASWSPEIFSPHTTTISQRRFGGFCPPVAAKDLKVVDHTNRTDSSGSVKIPKDWQNISTAVSCPEYVTVFVT
jgi:hypothetical protein